MEEIKKLVETWRIEKGSFIPNAPIFSVFIKDLDDAIERQENINKNKVTLPVIINYLDCNGCGGKINDSDNFCRHCSDAI